MRLTKARAKVRRTHPLRLSTGIMRDSHPAQRVGHPHFGRKNETELNGGAPGHRCRPQKCTGEVTMAGHLSFEQLNDALLEEFPDLVREFPEKIGPDPSPGQYVVFGSVFNDHIENSADDPAEARRVSEFIERLAIEGDGRTEDLLKIEIAPTLLSDQQLLNRYWPLLGQRTRLLLTTWAPTVAPDTELPT